MIDAGLKIAMVQDQPGSGIRKPYGNILLEKKPDILAFPEYYFVNAGEDNVVISSHRHDSILDELKNWSIELECAIIGGSVVTESYGKLFNRSYFINKGEVVGHYDKIHPYREEGRGLIEKGTEYRVFDFNDVKIGILICAARDNRLFVEGAKMTGSVIFKVCASGKIGTKRFQARSLVANSVGIAWRNPPQLEDTSALILARIPEAGDNTRLDIEVYRH
jgi:hypothetical protein